MLGQYPWQEKQGDEEFEIKGGKPSKGTPADHRLSSNQPGKKPMADDDDNTPPKKPAFPGAAPPFKSGGKKGK